MATLVTSKTKDNLYTLVNNETACHAFEARDDEFALVTVFHSLHGLRQDFSIRVWFSDEPDGDPLYTMPAVLRHVHPLGHPYRFALYADQADVSVNETGWDAEFNDGTRFDVAISRRPGPPREVPDHVTVVTGLTGTYWINIRNLVGSDNGYYLDIIRSPID